MALQPKDNQHPTVDRDNVAEVLCLGKFNIAIIGPVATLTFTHLRPKPSPLLDNGVIEHENVVRARIVTTAESLVHLRHLIDTVLKNAAASQTITVASGSVN